MKIIMLIDDVDNQALNLPMNQPVRAIQCGSHTLFVRHISGDGLTIHISYGNGQLNITASCNYNMQYQLRFSESFVINDQDVVGIIISHLGTTHPNADIVYFRQTEFNRRAVQDVPEINTNYRPVNGLPWIMLNQNPRVLLSWARSNVFEYLIRDFSSCQENITILNTLEQCLRG